MEFRTTLENKGIRQTIGFSQN